MWLLWLTVDFVGLVTLILILFYVAVWGMAKFVKVEESTRELAMPVLSPLIIPTKNQSSWCHKLVAFVTQVRHWKVEKDWQYTLKDEATIVIEKDFIFDGASIPKIFWAILSPTGILLIPALIHDYGYRYNKLMKVNEDGTRELYIRGTSKLYWDNLFREVADEVNGSRVINVIARLAVLKGGRKAWNIYRENDKKTQPVSLC